MKRIVPFLDDIFYWLGAGMICGAAAYLHPAAMLLSGGVFCLIWSRMLGKAMI